MVVVTQASPGKPAAGADCMAVDEKPEEKIKIVVTKPSLEKKNEPAKKAEPEAKKVVNAAEPKKAEPEPTEPAKKLNAMAAAGWGFLGNAFTAAPPRKKPSAKKDDDEDDDGRGMADELPVVSIPQDMFTDMVKRMPEIGAMAKSLSRPLRIATMCSGTEAPILALQMISNAVNQLHGVPLRMQHVFGCEIEPFKQAYIQRNLAPPLLFRDVRELPSGKGHTAFGALVDVPCARGDADILVAGTSCVDYSTLNNEKKGLNDGGESSQTFFGMFEWVKKVKKKPAKRCIHPVPIVILEK